jgi:hypothetical protein
MSHAAVENCNAHAVLLGIIAAHGLADVFSVHLIHRRFHLPEGGIMVYETIKANNSH